jgi:hypothetical protein
LCAKRGKLQSAKQALFGDSRPGRQGPSVVAAGLSAKFRADRPKFTNENVKFTQIFVMLYQIKSIFQK